VPFTCSEDLLLTRNTVVMAPSMHVSGPGDQGQESVVDKYGLLSHGGESLLDQSMLLHDLQF
jgi:hypothetical protein